MTHDLIDLVFGTVLEVLAWFGFVTFGVLLITVLVWLIVEVWKLILRK